jgi:hypothetical protein
MSKLQQRLKCQKPLIEYQTIFDTLNKLELLGVGSLAELALLHGIRQDFSTKDPARDGIVQQCVFTSTRDQVHIFSKELAYPG